MSRLEQETTCINGFRPASALAVNHVAMVKSSKIAQYVCAISRLCQRIVQSQDCLRNLEIGTQFRDSENALRNLEIAQIPKLRGTYIYFFIYMYRTSCRKSLPAHVLVSCVVSKLSSLPARALTRLQRCRLGNWSRRNETRTMNSLPQQGLILILRLTCTPR